MGVWDPSGGSSIKIAPSFRKKLLAVRRKTEIVHTALYVSFISRYGSYNQFAMFGNTITM
jgi:hypothetical protein